MIELKRNLVTTARMIVGKLDALNQALPDDQKISITTITISNGSFPPVVLLRRGFDDVADAWNMDVCRSEHGARYFYTDDKELIIADGQQRWRNKQWIR